MIKFCVKILTCLALLSHAVWADELAFSKELKVFTPFIGTWKASFNVPKGKPEMVDVSKWERALNGKALRTLHSINQGEYGGESLIFFDKSKQKIVFYYFTTADFYTQGTIEVINDNTFVAYEEVTGNQNGITQVKSTSTLTENGMTVSTSYLKNDIWTKPEQRVYQRTQEKVIFK